MSDGGGFLLRFGPQAMIDSCSGDVLAARFGPVGGEDEQGG